MSIRLLRPALAGLVALLFVSAAPADGGARYHVTITNITNSITFTPILVVTHRKSVDLFELGEPAIDELVAIAEDGNVGPATELLSNLAGVADVQNSGGLLFPGGSVTVKVRARHGAKRISLASMMLPTNDGFIGLDSVDVPRRGSRTYWSPGYDAGSEPNDELCLNIPGPTCGGTGPSPLADPGDEGYIHVHRGMHGIGSLDPAIYDWRNPVAKITIRKVGGDDD